jgi:hypothetical protein
VKKIKVWFRRKYLFWRYKHNKGTGKVIVTKQEDRQLGLTTMMINDCLNRRYMLFVPNEIAKKQMYEEIYSMVNSPTMTSSIDPNDYLITRNDINRGKLRGVRNVKLLIDNQCTYKDVVTLYDQGLGHNIENGFIYCPFVA